MHNNANARFVSVLDDESKLPSVTFSEAVMKGFAPDGGMYWPKEVPRFEKEELKSLAKKTYREQVETVLSKFLSGSEDKDFTQEDLKNMFKSDDPFKRFGDSNVLRTKTIDALDLDVVELWHGPTLAFKDLGMCILARVLERIVKKRNTKLTLLVGTSGDTGSAAAEAVRGLDNINLFVLYPKRNFSAITTIQERQMTVVSEKESNVNCIAVEGGSDALDVPIENLFHTDAKRLFLGSVNSVNIVRLIVQTVHYFHLYLKAFPNLDGGKMAFHVPSGAGGHLAAGLLALEMGLPNCRLVAATNENGALHDFFQTRVLKRKPETRTVSPSMDICVPYNVWRMLYTVCPQSVGLMYKSFETTGNLCVPEKIMQKLRARVDSVCVSNESTLLAMRDCFEASEYVLDPHTAVGVASVSRSSKDEKTVCFACAHPVKFPQTVRDALGKKRGNDVLKRMDKNHVCVDFVRNLASDLDPEKHPKCPPGCITILDAKSQDQWTSELRDVIETFLGIEKKKASFFLSVSSSSVSSPYKACLALGVVVVAALCVRKILAKRV